MMLSKERIIELRKLAKGDGETHWSESIAFARLIESEAYKAGQIEMRERAAEAGNEHDFGLGDVQKAISALEIKEPGE